jgi:ATP-binding cassette subfamily F protein 3
VQKQHEKAQVQLAKRIMKGKDSVYKTVLDEKTQEINASEANATLKQGIELSSLTLAYGSNVLLKDCTATFSFGHRYCMVARNGAGKSSLLRAIGANEIH